MVTLQNKRLMKEAIKLWGNQSQIMMAIEEMSELNLALCHHGRKYKDQDLLKLIGEIADVLVMIDQLMLIFGVSEKDMKALKEMRFAKLETLIAVYKESET